jgi:hypothetical protein
MMLMKVFRGDFGQQRGFACLTGWERSLETNYSAPAFGVVACAVR